MTRKVPNLTPDAAVREVVERVGGRGGTRWIGIDGFGGAGKTSFAERLRQALPESLVVHVDDFFRPDVDGWDRGGFRTAIVEPVLAGRPGRYRRWDWETATIGEMIEVPPGRPLIVEGVSSTDVRLGIAWDLTLWLDLPAAERWRRVMARDGDAFRDLWLNTWIPSEQAYAAAQHPQARVDLIVTPPPQSIRH